MTTTPDSVDRIESAANISLTVSAGANQQSGDSGASFHEVPISRLDTTKEIEITEHRESTVKASGYSVDSISYSGTMMFKGSSKTKTDASGEEINLDDLLYDEHGVPEPVSITITHDLSEDDSETYQTVLVTSESYEVRNEEATETAYDWIAMDRSQDNPS